MHAPLVNLYLLGIEMLLDVNVSFLKFDVAIDRASPFLLVYGAQPSTKEKSEGIAFLLMREELLHISCTVPFLVCGSDAYPIPHASGWRRAEMYRHYCRFYE